MQLCSSSWRFSNVAYRMTQTVFLGWKAGYSWCISTNLLFALGQTGLMEWLGFPPLKSMSQEGCGAAVLFPPHSPGKFMAAWSEQHKEFFLCLPVHLSQRKQSFANHWAVICSERIGGFSVQGVLYMQYIYYPGSLSLTTFFFSFFSYFWMGKWQWALESVEWTWESLVSIPEGSPAP